MGWYRAKSVICGGKMSQIGTPNIRIWSTQAGRRKVNQHIITQRMILVLVVLLCFYSREVVADNPCNLLLTMADCIQDCCGWCENHGYCYSYDSLVCPQTLVVDHQQYRRCRAPNILSMTTITVMLMMIVTCICGCIVCCRWVNWRYNNQ